MANTVDNDDLLSIKLCNKMSTECRYLFLHKRYDIPVCQIAAYDHRYAPFIFVARLFESIANA